MIRLSERMQELEECTLRISGRAAVRQQLAVDAVLGKAGIPKTLASVTDAEEFEQVLIAAREWDTEGNEPGVHELTRWVERWHDLRKGQQ